MKLTIELVPQTSWYSNVRSNVSIKEWDIIRRKYYKKTNYKCGICGGIGNKHPVECHEIWFYDDKNKKQILKGMIALCPNCHKVKHAGLAGMRGETDIVIAQLCKVNGMNKDEAKQYLDKSFEIWLERSKHKWELDISFIKSFLEVEDE